MLGEAPSMNGIDLRRWEDHFHDTICLLLMEGAAQNIVGKFGSPGMFVFLLIKVSKMFKCHYQWQVHLIST